jgi:hypothetical protein
MHLTRIAHLDPTSTIALWMTSFKQILLGKIWIDGIGLSDRPWLPSRDQWADAATGDS